MNKKIEKYGVKVVKRKPVYAKKSLDLTGTEGEQIIRSETKLVLQRQAKTFKKLADM